MKFPFLKPSPPRLSKNIDLLEKIENSGIYTNFGPVNSEFEKQLSYLFDESEKQTCLTVCNATIGLMIAVNDAINNQKQKGAKYCVLPSFTFAATGHAAYWNGLEPLFCDIDPRNWSLDLKVLKRILEKYGKEIAVIMPYATFGSSLDIQAYEDLSLKYTVPVVIDAAASLGSLDLNGKQFGAGSLLPIVFSMHATKSFSTAEGGVIYCKDSDLISRLKRMENFGFNESRSAVGIGINGKLPEVIAALALLRLPNQAAITEKRTHLAGYYLDNLTGFDFQQAVGNPSFQFFPASIRKPEIRNRFVDVMRSKGVELRTYFNPCLHEQPFFKNAKKSDLSVTESLSNSIVSFPLYESMSIEDVKEIVTISNKTHSEFEDMID